MDVSTSKTAAAASEVIGRRAVVVWAVGLAGYLVGIMHRTSFGIAALDAAERFEGFSVPEGGLVGAGGRCFRPAPAMIVVLARSAVPCAAECSGSTIGGGLSRRRSR